MEYIETEEIGMIIALEIRNEIWPIFIPRNHWKLSFVLTLKRLPLTHAE